MQFIITRHLRATPNGNQMHQMESTAPHQSEQSLAKHITDQQQTAANQSDARSAMGATDATGVTPCSSQAQVNFTNYNYSH